jgi:hypothetical protein
VALNLGPFALDIDPRATAPDTLRDPIEHVPLFHANEVRAAAHLAAAHLLREVRELIGAWLKLHASSRAALDVFDEITKTLGHAVRHTDEASTRHEVRALHWRLAF